ncbi:hypothetical protein TSUD_93870 [Trifolium subterraneum]|uniref:C-JID domain-containing protein n=1 Tax=Trifolium subterraneum TaxID=3900 RepID=A0A2Z6PCQ4_TRISU|nr:hypothetical protein TSUD_93870 [Trifolium subterraneum]
MEIPNFEEFPNLEKLNLEGCEKLEKLDPSIGLLTKIVCLNLEDCFSLISIPNTIFGISSLKYINMSGCSKVSFYNPGPMNIVKRASHFQSTSPFSNAPHCVMIPYFPLPVAGPCTINWGDLGTHRGRLKIGLHIFNCPKFGEREYRIAFSWMKQFIHANPQCPHPIDIVIPGSEIPSWFNNQSKGDTILIDNSPIKYDINNDIIGFLCCSLFSVEPSTDLEYSTLRSIYVEIDLNLAGLYIVDDWYLTNQNYLEVFFEERDLIKVKTNHIWLTYFPRKLSGYVEFPFGIWGRMDVKFDNLTIGRMSSEVKNCGYGWVRKQDLQEFNLTTMHPGNSSALKHKFLAIEDIHSSD